MSVLIYSFPVVFAAPKCRISLPGRMGMFSCAARVLPVGLGVSDTALAREHFVAVFHHRVVSGVLYSLSRYRNSRMVSRHCPGPMLARRFRLLYLRNSGLLSLSRHIDMAAGLSLAAIIASMPTYERVGLYGIPVCSLGRFSQAVSRLRALLHG